MLLVGGWAKAFLRFWTSAWPSISMLPKCAASNLATTVPIMLPYTTRPVGPYLLVECLVFR